jgi:hypothetical protein
VKLKLFEELLGLNQAFASVIRTLERMEKTALFDREQVRYSHAEIESTRVDVNRQFFDNFDQIVEDDARWAYEFIRNHDQKAKDPFDFYLEIKEREEARTKMGLPPRVILLPDWDKDDERRFDERRAKKRKQRQSKRKRRVAQKSKPKLAYKAADLKTEGSERRSDP